MPDRLGMKGSQWVEVASLVDLAPERATGIKVAGRTLALVNASGRVHAFDAVCPHRGGPLDQGKVWQGALECPWHHFRFDLETGANVYPANVYPRDLPHLGQQLRPATVFPTRVEAGKVFVCLPRDLAR